MNKTIEDLVEDLLALKITPISDPDAGMKNGKELIRAHSIARKIFILDRKRKQDFINAIASSKLPKERWSCSDDESGTSLTLGRQVHECMKAVRNL